MKGKVCIILVNFNGHSDTIECLESLYKSTYNNYQIIVVDNSSGEDSLNKMINWAEGKSVFISTLFQNLVAPYCVKPIAYQCITEDELEQSPLKLISNLVFVKAKGNRGFAGGNNLGMRVALLDSQVEYIWLLNNDTVVEAITLDTLTTFAGHTKAGMIGNKLLYYSNAQVIQAVGGRYNRWLGKITEIANGKPADWSGSFAIDYVIGPLCS